MIFLINTFLGFLIAQLYDVVTRTKDSQKTPNNFDIIFFFKDTWKKMLTSILLSLALSVLIWLNIEDFADLVGKDWTRANNIIYAMIGFAPELMLQYLKKKYGFLQPDEVKGYTRK